MTDESFTELLGRYGIRVVIHPSVPLGEMFLMPSVVPESVEDREAWARGCARLLFREDV